MGLFSARLGEEKLKTKAGAERLPPQLSASVASTFAYVRARDRGVPATAFPRFPPLLTK
ncbi:hypothetical protein SAMN06296052_12651 [Pontibacter ummariensis]|uniref:Uncharacterized protein n=1 Tax=Pontibacter ummariensis TaxID=1610492 RepID=A0A239K7E1_9BACT|nr:hypothetical protein SAMN06296052_12651 [Pontibacter ummariensis]